MLLKQDLTSQPMQPFFFSIRRRHTISTRDWSSDVCSSDLFFLQNRFIADLAGELRSGKSFIQANESTNCSVEAAEVASRRCALYPLFRCSRRKNAGDARSASGSGALRSVVSSRIRKHAPA